MVQVVSDGESAIDRLLKSKEKFDAVVLDVMLPGIDGFGVATALRQAKNYVPVLMLTRAGGRKTYWKVLRPARTITCPSHFNCPYFWRVFRGCCGVPDG